MEHKKYDHDAWMKKIEDGIAMGPYRPDWASLSEHPIPKWFRDAKFGLFLHWGLYSIPAFGSEWYSRYMYVKGKPEFAHHVETYGPQSKFGYKDFIPLFKAEKSEIFGSFGSFHSCGFRRKPPLEEAGAACFGEPADLFFAGDGASCLPIVLFPPISILRLTLFIFKLNDTAFNPAMSISFRKNVKLEQLISSCRNREKLPASRRYIFIEFAKDMHGQSTRIEKRRCKLCLAETAIIWLTPLPVRPWISSRWKPLPKSASI